MKKSRLAVVTIAFMLFNAAGCTLPFWSDLYGTWEGPWEGGSLTVIFDSSTLTWNAMHGSESGSLVFSLDEVDEAAQHIAMTVTSITGLFLSEEVSIGDVYYLTYDVVDRNSLYLSLDEDGYPPSATSGPFEKQ